MTGHPAMARTMGPVDALDVVRDTFQLGSGDDPTACPVLPVALEPGPELTTLGELAPKLPSVLVGVAVDGDAEAPEGFDVVLTGAPGAPRPWVSCTDLETTLSSLCARVAESPLASVALVQLLRLGGKLAVYDAIVAESFVYSMLQAGPSFRGWLASRGDRPTSEPEPDPILVERRDGHLEIRLNRPHVRNALNAAMRDALLSALQIVLVDHSITSVELSGIGVTFCSGGDLDEFGLASDPATAHAVRVGHSVGAALHRCAERVTVRLHGVCVGAGIEIPAFAARTVAHPDARFSLPEVGFGLIPGAGGTASLPRRVGRQRTAYLAISGTAITAPTSLEWGLVDEIGEE